MADAGANALAGRRRPVNVKPQQALLAHLPFDVDDFNAYRACHALCCLANLVQVHRHPETHGWPATLRYSRNAVPARFSPPTKKWARAHLNFRPTSNNDSINLGTGKRKPTPMQQSRPLDSGD